MAVAVLVGGGGAAVRHPSTSTTAATSCGRTRRVRSLDSRSIGDITGRVAENTETANAVVRPRPPGPLPSDYRCRTGKPERRWWSREVHPDRDHQRCEAG